MQDPNPKMRKLWFVKGNPTEKQKAVALAEGWSFRNANIPDEHVELCIAVCGEVPARYKGLGKVREVDPPVLPDVPPPAEPVEPELTSEEAAIAQAKSEGWQIHPENAGYWYKGDLVMEQAALVEEMTAKLAKPQKPQKPKKPAADKG